MAQLIIWNSLNQGNLYTTRSMGGYAIAAWARQSGFSAVVIEYCHRYTAQELCELTLAHVDEQSLAIGVSSTFWRLSGSLSAEYHEPDWVIQARTLMTQHCSEIHWILGGVNTVSMNHSRDFFDWKKIFHNSEDSLVSMLHDIQGQPGLTQRSFDVQNISSVFTDQDHVQSHEVLPIELGRGCRFKCKFCRYELIGKQPGTYLRHKNQLKAEIIYNYERWGTTRYFFLDDTVNESQEKLQDLVDIRNSTGIEFEWIGYCRLDLMGTNPSSVTLLEESGLRGAYIGIESFDPQASALVGKGWNGRHGKRFLRELQDRWQDRISYTLAFIVGLGHESADSILDTHRWCIDNGIHRWRYSGLHLTRERPQGNTSEFDRQAGDYGYRFTDPLRPHVWASALWTNQSAENFAKQLNTDSEKHAKLSAWQLGETATTTGQSFVDLLGRHVSDIDSGQLISHSQENLKSYWNSKLNTARLSWPG